MSIKNQQGAVLIVSLVVLFSLTLIGLSAMQMASLEEKIGSNSMNSGIAFHVAESAIVSAIAVPENFELAILNKTAVNLDITSELGYDPAKYSVSASINYLQECPASGSSIGVNAGSLTAHCFQISGQGRVPGSTNLIINQGASRLGPGGS